MSEQEKVLCPGCGRQMKPSFAHRIADSGLPRRWEVAYCCDYCGWIGPTGRGEQSSEAENSARAAALKRYTPTQKSLTVDDLRSMPLYTWVWIEILDPDMFKTWGKMARSAYYGKLRDDPNKHEFWCGFPAFACAFDYSRYGKSWIAFQHKPTDAEREAAKWEDGQ